MDALKLISQSSMKENAPVVNVGDTVKVHVRIKEGDKYRIQIFEGTVIAKKHGGINETFTVRRLSYGCGVERVFPVHSPIIEKVELAAASSTISAAESEKQLRLKSRSSDLFENKKGTFCPFFAIQALLKV